MKKGTTYNKCLTKNIINIELPLSISFCYELNDDKSLDLNENNPFNLLINILFKKLIQ